MSFKPGDRVKVIGARGVEDMLTDGAIYEVTAYNQGLLQEPYLTVRTPIRFITAYAYRFEKVGE